MAFSSTGAAGMDAADGNDGGTVSTFWFSSTRPSAYVFCVILVFLIEPSGWVYALTVRTMLTGSSRCLFFLVESCCAESKCSYASSSDFCSFPKPKNLLHVLSFDSESCGSKRHSHSQWLCWQVSLASFASSILFP